MIHPHICSTGSNCPCPVLSACPRRTHHCPKTGPNKRPAQCQDDMSEVLGAVSHTGGRQGFWSGSRAGRDSDLFSVSWRHGHRLPNIHAPFRMLGWVHGRNDLELRTAWGASDPWILPAGLFRNQRQWPRTKTIMNIMRETEGNDPARQEDCSPFPRGVSKDADIYRNKFKTAKLEVHFGTT